MSLCSRLITFYVLTVYMHISYYIRNIYISHIRSYLKVSHIGNCRSFGFMYTSMLYLPCIRNEHKNTHINTYTLSWSSSLPHNLFTRIRVHTLEQSSLSAPAHFVDCPARFCSDFCLVILFFRSRLPNRERVSWDDTANGKVSMRLKALLILFCM